MAKLWHSIMQQERECWVTGATDGLHYHHIFGGALRPISDENGFTVWLRGDFHNLSKHGVHFDRQLDIALKAACQAEYETKHSREDWMNLIGRNYLE